MPLAKDRELIAVTTAAQRHLKRIVRALKNKGLSATMTAYASELILSQPIPNDRHPAKQPAAERTAEAPLEK